MIWVSLYPQRHGSVNLKISCQVPSFNIFNTSHAIKAWCHGSEIKVFNTQDMKIQSTAACTYIFQIFFSSVFFSNLLFPPPPVPPFSRCDVFLMYSELLIPLPLPLNCKAYRFRLLCPASSRIFQHGMGITIFTHAFGPYVKPRDKQPSGSSHRETAYLTSSPQETNNLPISR